MRTVSSAWWVLLVLLAMLHCPRCSAQPQPAVTEKDGQQALDDLSIATAIIMEQDFSQGKSGVGAEAMLHHLRDLPAGGTNQQEVAAIRQRRRLGMKIKSFFEEQIYPDFRMVGRQMRRDANLVLRLLPPLLTRKLSSILAQQIKRKALRIWRGFSEVSVLPLLRTFSEILGFAAETVEDVADYLTFSNCCSPSSEPTGEATSSAVQEDIANTSEQVSLLENVHHEVQPSSDVSSTSSESAEDTQADSQMDLVEEDEVVEL